MAQSVSGVTVRSADGSNRSLGDYAGNVLLIVNVASRCGFTKQYAGLEALNQSYGGQGLKVLGFPCNDFGAQEPGTLEEIKSFCSTTYGASFELFDKVHATGSTTEPTPPSTKPNRPATWPGTSRSFLWAKTARCLPASRVALSPNPLN